MASSAHRYHQSTPNGAAAAPPPTPYSHTNLSSEDAVPDTLSQYLLHRLPPTLSLSHPIGRRFKTAALPPICLSDPTPSLRSALLSASTQVGFFQLTDHRISSHMQSTAQSLFNLPLNRKQLLFPSNWPLGYDSADNDDDDDDDSTASSGGESFCLDPSGPAGSTKEPGLDLGSLREFGCEMEKLGLKVLEELASAAGFENPARDDPTRLCSLLWVSSDGKGKSTGRAYPYVIGLHYTAECQKYFLSSDSGWVDVSSQADSVLVTVGDIAQVWSNGKLKKVIGRPMPSSVEADNNNSNCISMSLLITLPLESTVSPQIPNLATNGIEEHEDEEATADSIKKVKERSEFRSFPFEDYARRVYNERILTKDPLARYRL